MHCIAVTLTVNYQLSILVHQFILLRAEAWEQSAISVAALNGYLENIKFRFCVFHKSNSFLRVIH